MSTFVAGAVALGYAGGVIGLHRLNVHRLRKQAGFYPTLGWLDWDTLLSGVYAGGPSHRTASLAGPPEGGPPPSLLRWVPAEASAARQHELLSTLVAGRPFDPASIESFGFSGGEARWLSVLTLIRSAPLEALDQLEHSEPASVPEFTLREWLTLTYLTTPVNLELAVFQAKRRIAAAKARFSDHPALYFVRAKASSFLGLNNSVVDDLARAVYFSRQSEFYLRAVLESPFVEEARPALWAACRAALNSGAAV